MVLHAMWDVCPLLTMFCGGGMSHGAVHDAHGLDPGEAAAAALCVRTLEQGTPHSMHVA